MVLQQQPGSGDVIVYNVIQIFKNYWSVSLK